MLLIHMEVNKGSLDNMIKWPKSMGKSIEGNSKEMMLIYMYININMIMVSCTFLKIKLLISN